MQLSSLLVLMMLAFVRTGPVSRRNILKIRMQFTRSDDADIRKNWGSFKKEQHFEDSDAVK
jgi:hypothetical protein